MAQRVRTVRLDQGTPTTGIWCNACMTSGGVHVPLLHMNSVGVTCVAIGYGCITCDGPGDLQPDRPC